MEGDKKLREVAEPISQMEQLDTWQQSFNPLESSWWWYFTPPPSPSGFSTRFDWLWTGLALTCLALSIGLVTDMSPRFLSGGPDTFAAFAVVVQSGLTLLATGSILTKTGQEVIRRVFSGLTFIPKTWWEEIGLVAAALLLIILFGLRLSLPQIAFLYNEKGFDQHQEGQLTSARHSYERALKLFPDFALAHYNMGVLFEDLHDFDQAKAEYKIAAEAGWDVAYNNLARLHILDGEYDTALLFLYEGVRRVPKDDKNNEGYNEIHYSLNKNLGWARLGMKDYKEAKEVLQEAIQIDEGKAAAHCLLAQVLQEEKREPEGVINEAWEKCSILLGPLQRDPEDPPLLPEESIWRDLVKQYFNAQTKLEGEAE